MSSDELNSAELGKAREDLVTKAARFGAFGWIVALVLLLALITQSIIVSLTPQQTLATKGGIVVGQVVWDEARIRSNEDIVIDLKTWVQHCTSVNKHTVFEDLAICLNHMTSDLSKKRIKEYGDSNYATNISNIGCDKTILKFNNNVTTVKRDSALDYAIEGRVAGEIICPLPKGGQESQAFDIRLIAQLTERNTTYPLGMTVIKFEDIE